MAIKIIRKFNNWLQAQNINFFVYLQAITNEDSFAFKKFPACHDADVQENLIRS